jgi:aldose sugar dehydrogenase
VEVVAKGLSHPWGLAFLPDGRMLVSEREGRLRLVSPGNGALSAPITGVPAVSARGQGGLLGLALDPDFARNRQVYLCFSESRGGESGTSVFKGALSANDTALENGRIIFQQTPIGNTTRHFGCRLVFDRGGNLFITLGDRGNQSENAQKLDGHIGKVIRIKPDLVLRAS